MKGERCKGERRRKKGLREGEVLVFSEVVFPFDHSPWTCFSGMETLMNKGLRQPHFLQEEEWGFCTVRMETLMNKGLFAKR